MNLWDLDQGIPLRDTLLLELIKAVTIWTLRLIRNKICFNNTPIPFVASHASSIISFTSYCCKSRKDNSFYKLFLLLPFVVGPLHQPVTIIEISDSNIIEHANFSGSNPTLGLEGHD